MKKTSNLVSGRNAFIQVGPRLRPVAVAVSALLIPMGAGAQTAPAQDPITLEEIVVTGLRHSIEASVNVKKNNDSIVEAISSEDLGKLPDVSIGDALARLPGLTAQRVDGRSEVISIRGLDPKYGVTLLNGREIVSTGDNRSVEFDQFPAELINGVVVYKTPDAALGTQGLSGTIDMHTVRPLSLKETTVTLNARNEKNGNGALVPGSSAMGSRLSASYVSHFDDDKVGLAFGFAHLDSPGQEKYSKAWWWGDSAIWWGGFRGLENADPSKAPSTLQGFEAGVLATEHKRDGAMAVLEFKPNKDLHSQLDLYYSHFTQVSQGREFQASLMPDWSGNGTPGDGTCGSGPVCGGPIYSNVQTTMNGGMAFATSGTVTNVDPYIVERYGNRTDKIYALGWNTEYKLGGWTTAADLSTSRAQRREIVAEMYASSNSMSGFNFQVPLGNGFEQYTSTLSWSNPANLYLRGIAGWGADANGNAQAGSASPIAVDDSMHALRLSGKHAIDILGITNFEGGVNYNHRAKDYTFTQEIFTLKNAVTCAGVNPTGGSTPDTCAPIPAGLVQGQVNLGFAGNPGVISMAANDMMASGLYNTSTVNQSSAPGRVWGVTESVTTFYGKLGLDFDNHIMPIHGNLGVQYVHANQSSNGLAWTNTYQKDASGNYVLDANGAPIVNGGTALPNTVGTGYNDILPSLNLVADLPWDSKLRLGAAKTMARPNMDDMRAGATASVNSIAPVAGTGNPTTYEWSGSGGNPYLKPWRANSYDLALEKYIGKRSYVATAAYFKKLNTSIYEDSRLFNFAGYPSTNPNVGKAPNIGTMTAPVNGTGGFVRGFEFATQLDFGDFVSAARGFGTAASFTKANSNVPGTAIGSTETPDWKRPLEGLSGRVWSLVGYYEKDGWEARIAQRYRSDFIASVRGVWIANSMSAILSEKVTDLQLGYTFQAGEFKGLGFTFQVNNLGDTPYRTTSNDDSYTAIFGTYHQVPERYQTYGRETMLGVNYKF